VKQERFPIYRGRQAELSDSLGAEVRLAERAYRELEHLVITTALKPGEWVSETSLAQQLGLSRTPLREALQRLARANLIQAVPRRGLRITEVRVEDQLMVLEFRKQVENFLVRCAADRASPSDRIRFRQLAAAMTECAQTRDEAQHYTVDFEYKALLVQAANNKHAGDAIEPLWSSSRRFAWVTRASRDIGLSSKLCSEVMYAIADGNPDGAEKLNIVYMAALEQVARNTINQIL
jgi:DNA-binding GntR family transcriptional regulator